MAGQWLSGKAIADGILQEVRQAVNHHRAYDSHFQPWLHIIRGHNDGGGDIYVARKQAAGQSCGFRVTIRQLYQEQSGQTLPEDVQSEILKHHRQAAAGGLSAPGSVPDGIIVQMPLALASDSATNYTNHVARIQRAVYPAQDVDGLNPVNLGELFRPGSEDANHNPGHWIPCTPRGCLHLLRYVESMRNGDWNVAGKKALVIGRSVIVGRPMAALLTNADATVTVAHSQTENLAELCRASDIVVAATGQPHMIHAQWIKPGAIVLDVGITRIHDPAHPRGYRLCGDIDPQAIDRASVITPVPGGVGPLTVAMLIRNTYEAACIHRGWSPVSQNLHHHATD